MRLDCRDLGMADSAIGVVMSSAALLKADENDADF